MAANVYHLCDLLASARAAGIAEVEADEQDDQVTSMEQTKLRQRLLSSAEDYIDSFSGSIQIDLLCQAHERGYWEVTHRLMLPSLEYAKVIQGLLIIVKSITRSAEESDEKQTAITTFRDQYVALYKDHSMQDQKDECVIAVLNISTKLTECIEADFANKPLQKLTKALDAAKTAYYDRALTWFQAFGVYQKDSIPDETAQYGILQACLEAGFTNMTTLALRDALMFAAKYGKRIKKHLATGGGDDDKLCKKWKMLRQKHLVMARLFMGEPHVRDCVFSGYKGKSLTNLIIRAGDPLLMGVWVDKLSRSSRRTHTKSILYSVAETPGNNTTAIRTMLDALSHAEECNLDVRVLLSGVYVDSHGVVRNPLECLYERGLEVVKQFESGLFDSTEKYSTDVFVAIACNAPTWSLARRAADVIISDPIRCEGLSANLLAALKCLSVMDLESISGNPNGVYFLDDCMQVMDDAFLVAAVMYRRDWKQRLRMQSQLPFTLSSARVDEFYRSFFCLLQENIDNASLQKITLEIGNAILHSKKNILTMYEEYAYAARWFLFADQLNQGCCAYELELCMTYTSKLNDVHESIIESDTSFMLDVSTEDVGIVQAQTLEKEALMLHRGFHEWDDIKTFAETVYFKYEDAFGAYIKINDARSAMQCAIRWFSFILSVRKMMHGPYQKLNLLRFCERDIIAQVYALDSSYEVNYLVRVLMQMQTQHSGTDIKVTVIGDELFDAELVLPSEVYLAAAADNPSMRSACFKRAVDALLADMGAGKFVDIMQLIWCSYQYALSEYPVDDKQDAIAWLTSQTLDEAGNSIFAVGIHISIILCMAANVEDTAQQKVIYDMCQQCKKNPLSFLRILLAFVENDPALANIPAVYTMLMYLEGAGVLVQRDDGKLYQDQLAVGWQNTRLLYMLALVDGTISSSAQAMGLDVIVQAQMQPDIHSSDSQSFDHEFGSGKRSSSTTSSDRGIVFPVTSSVATIPASAHLASPIRRVDVLQP